MRLKRTQKILALFNQQAGLCAYCCVSMTTDLGHKHTATVDHVQPRSKVGNAPFNAVAVCYDCNQKKADKSLLFFLWQNKKR